MSPRTRTWLRSWLPNAARTPAPRPRARLAAEQLEAREVPAGFSFPDFSSTAGLTLVGSVAVNASNQLRLTPAVSSQGAAWYTAEKVLVAGSFDTTFRFRLSTATGGADGSDGFAFVIQNSGPNELRMGGGRAGLQHHAQQRRGRIRHASEQRHRRPVERPEPEPHQHPHQRDRGE